LDNRGKAQEAIRESPEVFQRIKLLRLRWVEKRKHFDCKPIMQRRLHFHQARSERIATPSGLIGAGTGTATYFARFTQSFDVVIEECSQNVAPLTVQVNHRGNNAPYLRLRYLCELDAKLVKGLTYLTPKIRQLDHRKCALNFKDHLAFALE
jgi:hypothetical protein